MGATRCPDCRKFATINSETECALTLEDFDINDPVARGTIRMPNECADCGTEISQHEFDIEIDFSDVINNHDCPEKDTGVGWSFETGDVERSTREHPPHAKVRKKFYQVSVDITLNCNCEEKISETRTFNGEIQASSMEILV